MEAQCTDQEGRKEGKEASEKMLDDLGRKERDKGDAKKKEDIKAEGKK